MMGKFGANFAKSDPWLLHRHLLEHSEAIGPALIGNAINAVISTWLFWGVLSSTSITVGLVIISLIIGHRFFINRSVRRCDGLDFVQLTRVNRSITVNAALLGAAWGGATYLMMHFGGPGEDMYAGIIGSGMMAAGTITYRSVPRAAQAYLLLCGFISVFALLDVATVSAYTSVVLLACYLFVLLSSVRKNYDQSVVRHERERALEESEETIRLLLNEYHEQASDWLVVLDGEGRITTPSEHFCKAAKRSPDQLEGKRLTQLILEDDNAREMASLIERNTAFRGALCAIRIEGALHWWSVNLRPRPEGGWRGVFSDVTAQYQAEQQVRYLASYDSLTTLPNRILFNEQLATAFKPDGGFAALLYLDLDRFKEVNDSLGHPVGDQLLKSIGCTLLALVGTKGMVARLGGDEFAIILHPANEAELEAMADRLIAALERPHIIGQSEIMCSGSIGIARSTDGATDLAQLNQFADLALYAAKADGRGRWRYFEQSMNDAAQVRRVIEAELRNALSNGELKVHYQPQVDVTTNETSGYEALLRWESPVRGFIQPSDFIPIAEESGLVIPIGEWVIREALIEARTWPEHYTIAVNLSPIQLRSPNIIGVIISALAASGVAPERLELEITETVLLQDSDVNIATLNKIHQLGVKIALDDFGTGYSSLSYLRRFPFDKIKIDRSFVENIDEREDCQAIVRSVVSLANSLGMSITAEGVEREGQLAHLKAEGCTHVQGFLFSKALSPEQFTDLRAPLRKRACS